MLDKLADDTVSGLKASFARRISAGEDPTAFLKEFLRFLESNRKKSPQFIRQIASRIDSSFFAPLRKADDIPSPDDFIAAYHNLVNKLLEIDPEMPYWKDYDRQKARIDEASSQIEEEHRREELAKRKIVDDEYGSISSERNNKYRRSGSGKRLLMGFTVSLTLAAAFLIISAFVSTPMSPGGQLAVVGIPAIIGALLGLTGAGYSSDWKSAKGSAMAGLLAGGALGALIAFILIPYSLHLSIASGGVGIALLLAYKAKVAGIQFTPDERSAYNASLQSIDDHFSLKRRQEITEATLRILTTDR